MAAGLGFKDFVTGEVLTAADVDGYLMQGIWVFADATARDAAVTLPQEGNACYLKDTDVIQVYSGSSWVNKSQAGSFVGANVYKTSAQSISNATFTTINFEAENFDTDSFHSTVTNTSRLTIPAGKDGKYLVTANLAFDTNATGIRACVIRKNGADYAKGTWIGAFNESAVLVATQMISLVATDYVEMQVYQSSGGSLNIKGDSASSMFSIQYLGA